MEFKLALIFITLALVGAEECGERKAEECVGIMLSLILEDISDAEACGELVRVAGCLQEAADECVGEEHYPDIVKGLEELNNLIEQNCPSIEVSLPPTDEELEKCLDEHTEYIIDCLPESLANLETAFAGSDDADAMKCALFQLMSKCFSTKVSEKCGDEAGDKMGEMLAEIMQGSELSENCSASTSLSFFTNQLLEKRRRRK